MLSFQILIKEVFFIFFFGENCMSALKHGSFFGQKKNFLKTFEEENSKNSMN